MKRPAQIKEWLSPQELGVWVREAPTRDAYRRRLAVWLSYTRRFHADEVARMLLVSKQAVWLWVGQYNKEGPSGLDRRGRGGRRWGFLSWPEEEALLSSFRELAGRGEILTAKHMLPDIRKAVGKEVSLAYVYRLLRRHGWRKLEPRPRHVKADPEAQEKFKKNCP